MKTTARISILSLALLLINATSFAALEQIIWGDFTGNTIKYLGVSESSETDSLDINNDGILDNSPDSVDGLYGRPRLDGDTLAFDDLDFFSYSTGQASDITDGKLAGQIVSLTGHYVDKIGFTEYGDATLAGDYEFGQNAKATITNTFFIKVQWINDVDIPDIAWSVSMTVNPNGGSWKISEDGSGTFSWDGSLMVDVTAKIREEGYLTGYATVVDFTMDNTLTTAAGGGGSAYIAKKESGGLTVSTYTVPEPMTLALLGLGGLLIRKKNSSLLSLR